MKIVRAPTFAALSREKRSGIPQLISLFEASGVVIEIRIRPDYLVFAEMLVSNKELRKTTFLVEVKQKIVRKKKVRESATRRTARTK